MTAIDNLKAAVAEEPVLGVSTYETNPAGDLGLLSFQLGADPFSDQAVNAVDRLRHDYIPSRIRRRRREGLRHRQRGH